MILTLRVKPGSKLDSIEYGKEIIVRIKQRPVNGKANLYLIKFLAKEFKIPLSSIEIVAGETSNIKRVQGPFVLP
jgi:uncharacterized protein